MKKTHLTIRRDTLRTLSSKEITAARGGAPTNHSHCCATLEGDACTQLTATCPFYSDQDTCACTTP